MVRGISQIDQLDPAQAIRVFKKLISALKLNSRQIIQEINHTEQQISFFSKNIELIKTSKYYRFLDFTKNTFKF